MFAGLKGYVHLIFESHRVPATSFWGQHCIECMFRPIFTHHASLKEADCMGEAIIYIYCQVDDHCPTTPPHGGVLVVDSSIDQSCCAMTLVAILISHTCCVWSLTFDSTYFNAQSPRYPLFSHGQDSERDLRDVCTPHASVKRAFISPSWWLILGPDPTPPSKEICFIRAVPVSESVYSPSEKTTEICRSSQQPERSDNKM